MNTASRKAKGRSLQKYLRDKLLEYSPGLTPDDVRSTPMGTQGEDVMLSAAAKALWPFRWECKNQEGFGAIYTSYEQCTLHPGVGEPVLLIKSNRKRPLVVLDADYFFRMCKK